MSEETHGTGEQLFDTDIDEVAEDNATDTNDQETESEDEQQQEGINLEDKGDTASKAEEARRKQISAVQSKIDRGELTLDDLKPAQSWMKSHLMPKEDEQKVDPKQVARQIAQEVIQEEREAARFSSMKDALDDMALSRDDKKLLSDKFALLRSKGLSKLDALEMAVEVAGIDISESDERRRRMAIPKRGKMSSQGTSHDAPYGEIHKTVSEEQRYKMLRDLVK